MPTADRARSRGQIDRAALRRTIAVVNGKGGVGKTSVTANLAGLYADAGYKVLAVELDPQGNLGSDLGYLGAGLSDDGEALHRAGVTGNPPQPIGGVRANLDVVPGGDHLHDLAAALQARRVSGRGGVDSLAAASSGVATPYDLVLIDCPPGSDVLQAGALTAARWVLVPTKTDDASRAGLREMARRFAADRAVNPELMLLGVVPFGVNSSARRVIGQARDALAGDLGGVAPVLEATIGHGKAAAVNARTRPACARVGAGCRELPEVVRAAPQPQSSAAGRARRQRRRPGGGLPALGRGGRYRYRYRYRRRRRRDRRCARRGQRVTAPLGTQPSRLPTTDLAGAPVSLRDRLRASAGATGRTYTDVVLEALDATHGQLEALLAASAPRPQRSGSLFSAGPRARRPRHGEPHVQVSLRPMRADLEVID